MKAMGKGILPFRMYDSSHFPKLYLSEVTADSKDAELLIY